MTTRIKPQLPSEMQLMWYCMSSPCIGIFMPVYANVSAIPDPFLTGGGPEDISSYDPSSAWWAFKKLQLLVDENYEELHPVIRARWDELYADAVTQTSHLEDELSTLFEEERSDEARRLMDLLVEERLTEAYQSAIRSVNELSGEEETASVEEEIIGDEKNKMILHIALITTIVITCGILLYLVKIRNK